MKRTVLGMMLALFAVNLSAGHLDDMEKENRRYARQAGYHTESHDIARSELNQGDSRTHRFTLNRNTSYRIYGDCDEDCSDMDFVLYDENGNVVADDELDDSVPIVDVRPRRTARYALKVTMHRCSVEPCAYAIQIFRK